MDTSYSYGVTPGTGSNKEDLRGGRKAPSKRRQPLTENTDLQTAAPPKKASKPNGRRSR
jgi:hypothetical protein